MRALVVALLVLSACGRSGGRGAGAPPDAGPTPPSTDAPPAEPPPPAPASVAPSPLCWTNAPQGASLAAVWASAPRDAWVVGSPALALHWDGERFVPVPVPTDRALRSVWSPGAGDVWLLAADGAAWRGDGARFDATLPPGSASGWIRGRGARDVWAGDWHWDGERWTRFPLVTEPYSYWLPGARVVPLGGGAAFAVYWGDPSFPFASCASFDGARWTGGCPPMESILPWSSGEGDLWVAGATRSPPQVEGADYGPISGNRLARRDGAAWSSDGLPSPDAFAPPILTGSAPDDVWFGAPSAHFDGRAWTAVELPGGPAADAAAAPGALFTLHRARAAGGPATKVRLTDGDGSRELLDVGAPIVVTGEVAGERLGVTAEGLVRLDGRGWVSIARAAAPFDPPFGDLNDRLFGAAADDVWVVRYGRAEAWHWDGRRWATVAYPGSGYFWPGGSAARGRAWLVGVESTVIGPTSTQRWRLFTSDAGHGLTPVTALGDDDVWAVTALGSGETLAFATRRVGPEFGPWSRVLWRHDGVRWTEAWSDAPNGEQGWWPLPGVRSADDVWAFANAPSVGDGLIQIDLLRWDGARMQRVARLRGAEGHTAAVVGRGEAWVSTGDEARAGERGRTAFLRVTAAGGLEASPVATMAALARQLWATPAGAVAALSDAGAVWGAAGSCSPAP